MKARRAHRRARARRGEIAWSTPPRRGLRLRHALSFLVVGVLLVPWVRSWSTQGPASASLLPFERRELGPLLTDSADGMHVLTNCSSARDIQRYAGGWWVATGGGLIAVPSNPDGRALVFGRPAGLPDHDIRCLAAFRGGLLLGTAQAGVVWYRNGRLTTFSAPDASWMNVHALLPMGGDRVLVGTQGGLLEFDGVSWRRACPDGRRSVPAPVTSLVLWNGRPAVGTPEGLYVVAPTRRSGGVQLRCIGTADGLPSAAVTSLATWGDSLVVGAAGGTALLTPDMAVKILDAPRNVTAVAHTAAGLWAGTGEGYVVAPQCEGVARLGRVNRLIPAGGRLVAATENGLFTHRGGTDWSPWPNLPESGLSDNVVTALADDPDGRVWVGYGSGDVDVLDADSSTRLRRLRGPYAAPVSWIARDEETGTMWVSTPRGLWSAAPGRGDVGTVPALSPSSILTFVGRQGRLLAAQASISEPVDARNVFKDFYFYIFEYKNKVLSACERKDVIAAGFAAFHLQEEICQCMNKVEDGFYGTDFNLLGEYTKAYEKAGFPDLLESASRGDLEELAKRVRRLDEKAIEWFRSHSIELNILESEEELHRFLNQRDPV